MRGGGGGRGAHLGEAARAGLVSPRAGETRAPRRLAADVRPAPGPTRVAAPPHAPRRSVPQWRRGRRGRAGDPGGRHRVVGTRAGDAWLLGALTGPPPAGSFIARVVVLRV